MAEDGLSILTPKRLVAGELGYTVGSSYTSLSGFRLSDANGAGTVQCCAVAKLLLRCGFQMWDLGMGMTYKYELGAKDVPRSEFLSHLSRMRGEGKEGKEGEEESRCVLRLDNKVLAVDLLKEQPNGVMTCGAEVNKDDSGSEKDQQQGLSKKKSKVLAKKQAKMAKFKTTEERDNDSNKSATASAGHDTTTTS